MPEANIEFLSLGHTKMYVNFFIALHHPPSVLTSLSRLYYGALEAHDGALD